MEPPDERFIVGIGLSVILSAFLIGILIGYFAAVVK